jgi:hypothetical protein
MRVRIAPGSPFESSSEFGLGGYPEFTASRSRVRPRRIDPRQDAAGIPDYIGSRRPTSVVAEAEVTHFEYVAAAHTLLLTFAAARILAGVFNALRPRRLYWVHLSWVSLGILFCVTSFWVFWGFREVEWTLPRLIVLLAAPGLIYGFSSMLVPANSAEVESWREYFFEVRLQLFCVGFLMVVVIISTGTLSGLSPFDSVNIPLWALLAVFVVGAVSERPALHNVLALVPPLFIVAILLSPVAETNWNAP